ncbi:MAG: hypothetical protein J6X78_09950 [Treponema sp.]|nr:hypothetical protein [Treponema sp.]
MRKLILVLFSLSLTVFCFANGRCEKLEKEILKNPNVIEVKVGQYDKWTQEIYFADIYLKNGGYLEITEFNRYLSGKQLGVEKIGRNSDGTPEYEFLLGRYVEKKPDKNGFIYTYRMDAVKTEALSLVLKKDINNVGDIINNYDEIYILAEKLAKETPEERTNRRKDGEIQDDSNFSSTFGNFESDKCWGQVFSREYSSERTYDKYFDSMFADE